MFNPGVMNVIGFAFDPVGHLAILVERGEMSLADLRFLSAEAPEDRKVPMSIKVRACRAETTLTANVGPHFAGLRNDACQYPPQRVCARRRLSGQYCCHLAVRSCL